MTQLLKPGYLVSLKTSLTGGVTYDRQDLPAPEGGDEHTAVARWETTRVIEDEDEYQRAVKARSAARSAIVRVCVHTAFGLLCPEAREPLLDEAIRAAQDIASAHNASAGTTSVQVFVLRGRIASTDEEATRAIASEVRELLDEMQSGIRRTDVEAIRQVATRAKQLGAVLDGAEAESVKVAVKAAREAASLIVKRVTEDAPEALQEALKAYQSPVEAARFSFLDLEAAPAEPEGTRAPDINVQRMAELASEVA